MRKLRAARENARTAGSWLSRSTVIVIVASLLGAFAFGIVIVGSSPHTDGSPVGSPTKQTSSELSPALSTPGIAGYHWFSPGGNVQRIAYDNLTGDLYVTVQTGNDVEVLSDLTGASLGTISVGTTPIGAAYSPFSNSIYVANEGSGTISVIKALGVTKTITVTGCPEFTSLNLKNKDLYITNPCGNNVTVLSTSTNKPVASLPASNPDEAGYDPVTGDTYVSNYGSYNITVFSSKNTVVGYIPFSNQPYQAVYDAATNRMYVGTTAAYVSVINGLTFVTNISVCGGTAYDAYDPLDQMVYTDSCGQVEILNSTAVVDEVYGEVDNPQGMTYDPGTGDMLVANYGNGLILVFGAAWGAPATSVTLSKEPMGIATTPNGYEYITNEAGSSVSVVDALTGAVVKTVPVGHKPLGVTFDSAQNTVFVADSGSSEVSVISTSTNAVVANVTVGAVPTGISYDPVDDQVDVTDFGAATVSVIDASTDTLAATIGVGSAPTGIDASSGTVYVANSASDNVTVIDGATNSVSWSVAVSTDPQGVLYDQGWVFVADEGANAVSAIYAYTSWSVSYTFGTDTDPVSLAVAGDNLLVGCAGSDDILLFNETSNAQGSHSPYATLYDVGSPEAMAYLASTGDVYVTQGTSSSAVLAWTLRPNTVDLDVAMGAGTSPLGGAFDSTNGDLYVAEAAANDVAVLSGSTNAVVTTVSVGKSPDGIAYDPTNQYVYVSNGGASTVSVINGSSNKVLATVTVGKAPGIPGYDPKNGDIYVPNSGSNNVTVLSGTSVLKSVAVGSKPSSAVYDPKNLEVLVTNAGSENVSLLSSTSPFSVAHTVSVGGAPDNSAYDASTGVMYVVNTGSGNLSVISSAGVLTHTVDLGTTVGLTGAIAFLAGTGELFVGENATDLVVILSGYNTVGSFLNGYGTSGMVLDGATGALYIANPTSESVAVVASGL